MDNLNEKDLVKLGRLFTREAKNAWEIGEEINRLKPLGWLVSELAIRFNRKPNRLSEYAKTADDFPTAHRDYDYPFTHYTIARRIEKKNLAPDLTLPEIREIVSTYRDEKGKTLGQPRDALRYFGLRRAQNENRANVESSALRLLSSDIVGKCHYSPYELILDRMPNGSIKLLHLDPPYANYTKFNSGALDHSTAAARIDCDNADGKSALAVTLASLPLASQKLAEGGCAVLWQSTVGTARVELLQAIEANGLEVERECWWDKIRPVIEGGDECYNTQAERFYLIKRKGDTLRNHDPALPRGNIIRIHRTQMKAETSHQHHFFEKPAEMNRYLIRKHSYEGDLVFDAFGCSGGFCIEAERLGRQWVYCESNANNFQFGTENMAKGLPPIQRMSA